MERVVGVDIGCTKMYLYAQVDGQHVEKKVPTGLDCPRERLKHDIDTFIDALPFVPDGLGMAVPGLVEGDYRVKLSDIGSLSGISTDYFGEGRFPVRFINDVKSATVAETVHYRDKDTIAVIMAGSGIAIGVYSKERMFTGAHGFAGELGYCITQTEHGPKTLDSLAGGIGILTQASCGIDEFLGRITREEPDTMELLAQAGHHFGLALTNVIHLFNPDVIVIGGSTATYPGYMEHALATAQKHTIPEMFKNCLIAKARDNKRIVALGAMEYIRSGMQL
ncbi:ROK family protein [Paenibacillus sp. HJL G12]|uniref:ROK family protein n=1 Tax=Paenibacillus dendrobii TaxID=2691084 RepID=A0A7X3LIN4_9BACL|nr:ROK family protein [Paenibacillus dendrobii]MWV45425.1 ROK family protein [Paenibacillus dendrobii]